MVEVEFEIEYEGMMSRWIWMRVSHVDEGRKQKERRFGKILKLSIGVTRWFASRRMFE